MFRLDMVIRGSFYLWFRHGDETCGQCRFPTTENQATCWGRDVKTADVLTGHL